MKNNFSDSFLCECEKKNKQKRVCAYRYEQLKVYVTSHDSSLIHNEEAVLTRTPIIIKKRINKTAFYVTRVIHYITAYDLIYRVYIV